MRRSTSPPRPKHGARSCCAEPNQVSHGQIRSALLVALCAYAGLPCPLPATAGEIADLLAAQAEQLQRSPHSRDPEDLDRPLPPYRRIGLERGRTCANEPCPTYAFFIYPDGSVLYHGQGFPPDGALPNGESIAQLDASLLFELRSYLEHIDLNSLDTLYGIPGTGQVWSIVLIETDLERRLIADYGHGAPVDVWALIALLEHAVWSSLRGNTLE